MAIIPPPPKWGNDEHTVEVPLVYVRYHGTANTYDYVGVAPPIRVCVDCRRSQELCRCPWRLA